MVRPINRPPPPHLHPPGLSVPSFAFRPHLVMHVNMYAHGHAGMH
jgi:hypothetical protein